MSRRTCAITVPVLRSTRRGDRHFALDLSVRVRLTLGSDGGGPAAVDADTLARTVHEQVADCDQAELLALAVARQCHAGIADVVRAQVDVRARGWNRLDIGGRPRERDLIGPAGEDRLARAVVGAGVARVAAGFTGMLLFTAVGDDAAGRPSSDGSGDNGSGAVVQRLGALWTYGWTEVPFETQWQQVRRGLTEAYAERGPLTGGALAEALGRAVIEESPPVRSIRVTLGVAPDGIVHGRALRRNEAVE